MDTITLWTRQVPEVYSELMETGSYIVKEEYIRAKNDNIADYYLDIYKWFTKKSREYITIPEGIEYPVWLSVTDEKMLQPIEGAVILKLEIPRDKVLIVDMRKWELRGNYMYIPLNEEDLEKHYAELDKYGISDDTSLIQSDKGNFYPLLKQKLIKSWDRLFTIPADEILHMVATTWELKKEWVKEVLEYEG